MYPQKLMDQNKIGEYLLHQEYVYLKYWHKKYIVWTQGTKLKKDEFVFHFFLKNIGGYLSKSLKTVSCWMF